MNSNALKIKHALSQSAMVIGFLTLAPLASALSITASVEHSLDGVPGATDTDGPASSGSVDVLDFVSDVSGNDVFYHTYGNDTGHFGSRVSGSGTYEIEGIFSYANTYTNSSASAQAFDFAFEVIPGQLAVYGDPAFGTATSNYSLDIRLNGSSIWDSAAELELTGAGFSFSDTGSASLGGTYNGTDNYSWSTFTETLGLGTFAAGESFTIEYDLITYAMGTFSSDCVVEVDGGEGDRDGEQFVDPDLADGGSFVTPCGGIARIGDPFTLGGGNSAKVVPVSAPNGIVLMMLGLFSILPLRRKLAA